MAAGDFMIWGCCQGWMGGSDDSPPPFKESFKFLRLHIVEEKSTKTFYTHKKSKEAIHAQKRTLEAEPFTKPHGNITYCHFWIIRIVNKMHKRTLKWLCASYCCSIKWNKIHVEHSSIFHTDNSYQTLKKNVKLTWWRRRTIN